ncbi:DUF397 domain-containing protein [Streptomyces sp. DSM 40750]|uniref:DUF397 domain-containing protein n=1 Tax=Streptomyces sp. DSM 40750 TaxID=2801030 RepID=UPI00214B00E6|nr:DUF397 domain-containing protein [Streptomyces sp. DSM 40750]UUU22907.1 DUF397 domain-containing protein [Streptomyces sp. DSM 40750]
MTSALGWFKSSYSGNDEPDCVEVAMAPTNTTVHVRDSKDQQGAQLAFTNGSWTAFVGSYSAA